MITDRLELLSKSMKYLAFGTIAACGLMSTMSPSFAVETIRLTIATGQAETFLWVKHLKHTFLPVLNEELAKSGETRIEWLEGYGGTIVKQGSEAEALQQGIMDVGQISGTYNPSQLGLLNLGYAMPFGPESARLVTEAAEHALRETKALVALEQAVGIVYIGGGFALDDYNIGSKAPLAKLDDLKGRKIGGVGAALTWIGGAGAVGVQGSLLDHYNNIQSGLYEGYIGWVTGSIPAKMYEVAPYWNRVHFGATYVGGIGVAKPKWDTFSASTKAAFQTAAAAYSKAYFDELETRVDKGLETMRANGVTMVEFNEPDREAWIRQIPNPTTAWMQASAARGEPAREVLGAYRDFLDRSGFKFVRDYLAE